MVRYFPATYVSWTFCFNPTHVCSVSESWCEFTMDYHITKRTFNLLSFRRFHRAIKSHVGHSAFVSNCSRWMPDIYDCSLSTTESTCNSAIRDCGCLCHQSNRFCFLCTKVLSIRTRLGCVFIRVLKSLFIVFFFFSSSSSLSLELQDPNCWEDMHGFSTRSCCLRLRHRECCCVFI